MGHAFFLFFVGVQEKRNIYILQKKNKKKQKKQQQQQTNKQKW